MTYASTHGLGRSFIQDNDNLEIAEDKYSLCIESAEGCINHKIRSDYGVEKFGKNHITEYPVKLDNPISLSYNENGELDVNGDNVELTSQGNLKLDEFVNKSNKYWVEHSYGHSYINYEYNERMPVIDSESFQIYKTYYKLDDGRDTRAVNGVQQKDHVSKAVFISSLIENLKTMKVKGIDPDKLKVSDRYSIEGLTYEAHPEIISDYMEEKKITLENAVRNAMSQGININDLTDEQLITRYMEEQGKEDKGVSKDGE